MWSPSRCYEFLNNEVLSGNFVIDTGNFAIEAEHLLSFSNEKKYFGSSISRFMGTAIPTAIGVAIGNITSQTICIFGDGGISPYLSDLKIIRENNLPICLIFMSDGGYGSIAKSSPKNSCLDAIYINKKSWIKLIKEFQIPAFTCKNLKEFRENFCQWDKSNPIFLECVFNKKEYMNQTTNIR